MAKTGAAQAKAFIVPKPTSAVWRRRLSEPNKDFSLFSSLFQTTQLFKGINLLGKTIHYIPSSPIYKREEYATPKCYPALITNVTSSINDMILVNLLWRDELGNKYAESGIRYQGFPDHPTKDPWLYPNVHNENHFPTMYPPPPKDNGNYQGVPSGVQYTYVRVPDAAPSATYSGCSTISDSTLNDGQGTTICWDNGVETFRAVGLTNDQAGQAQIDYNNGAYRQENGIDSKSTMIKDMYCAPTSVCGAVNLGPIFNVAAVDNSENPPLEIGDGYAGVSATFPNLRRLGLRVFPEIQPPMDTRNIPTRCQQNLVESKTMVRHYIALTTKVVGIEGTTRGVPDTGPRSQVIFSLVYDCSGNDYWVIHTTGIVPYYSPWTEHASGPLTSLSSHTLTFFQGVGAQAWDLHDRGADPGGSGNYIKFILDSIVVATVATSAFYGGVSVNAGIENRNNMEPDLVKLYGPVVSIPTHTISNMRYYARTDGVGRLFSGRDRIDHSQTQLNAEWASDSSIIVRSYIS